MRIPFILSLLLNICASIAFLQAQSVDSDPVRLGWMQGFPPPADKVVRAADGSFFRFPALRYSVCHMRSFLPTVAVPAATVSQPHTFFSVDDAAPSAIDTVQFLPIGSNKPMSWAASLEKNYTDGILVLHRGRIVYERYFGCLQPDGVHAVMSVSKTFAGTLGAMLVAEGVLDEHRTAASYVPALASSALGTATIRQLLDMTTGLKYSEDYSDPKAEVWAFSAAGNTMLAHPKDYQGPTNYYEYLATVQPQGTHGTAFAYKTINTDALGWVISVATGKPLATLLSERIWQPLGTERDGYYQVDPAGIAFAGGGFSAGLRDLARFGYLMLNKGELNGKQLLPAAVVADIEKGGATGPCLPRQASVPCPAGATGTCGGCRTTSMVPTWHGAYTARLST